MTSLVWRSRKPSLLLWLVLLGIVVLYAMFEDVTADGLKRTQLFFLQRRAIYPLFYGASIFFLWKIVSLYRTAATKTMLPWVGVIAGWAWCLFVGAGALGILLLRGPWPPTNGWFALMSALAACPLTGQLLRDHARLKVSGWQQFGAAVLLVALGRFALTVWPQAHPL
jgi:hypothetical protein